MPLELIWSAVGVSLLVVALAAVVVLILIARLAHEVSVLTRDAGRLLDVVEAELPATLAEAHQLTTNLNRLSAELPPRFARVDTLLEEADASMVALRSSLEATEDMVRAPIDAVVRARERVRSIGEGIADRADRFRQRVEEVARGEDTDARDEADASVSTSGTRRTGSAD